MARIARSGSAALICAATLALMTARASGQDIYVAWQNQATFQVSIWQFSNEGSSFTPHDYGPFGPWQPRAASRDASGEGGYRLLWGDGAGNWSLWNAKSDGTFTFTDYGPFSPDWQPQGMAASNGFVFIVWQNQTTGQVSLWKKADGSPSFTFQDYGPFDGGNWQVHTISATDANHVHIFWQHLITGQASLWSVDLTNSSSNNFTFKDFGPFPGWQVQSMDEFGGTLRVMWENDDFSTGTDNAKISIWKLDGQGNFLASPQDFGPFMGWAALNLQTDGDGSLVLWESSDQSMASIWQLNDNGTFTQQTYGPFPDWAVLGAVDN